MTCTEFNYTINGSILEKVDETKDLGVIMNYRLSFEPQESAVIAKAMRLVSFIRRTTVDFLSPHTILHLYKSLVIPTITNSSPVWSPYNQDSFTRLEAIQHKILRYMSCKISRPMSYLDHNFEPLMRNYKLLSLKTLFNYCDLVCAHKIIKSGITVGDLKILFSSRDLPYSLRYHRPLIEEFNDVNYLFYTPLHRLRRSYNGLAASIIGCDNLPLFKRLLLISLGSNNSNR